MTNARATQRKRSETRQHRDTSPSCTTQQKSPATFWGRRAYDSFAEPASPLRPISRVNVTQAAAVNLHSLERVRTTGGDDRHRHLLRLPSCKGHAGHCFHLT